MKSSRKSNILKRFWEINESGIIIIVVAFAIFSFLLNNVFLSIGNILNIFRATGFTLIVAIGETLVLILGGLDLSVGAVLGLSGIMAGLAIQAGIPIFLAVILGILTGAFCGLITGSIIIKLHVPPFIMTLGMLNMARGLIYIITMGVPVYPLPLEFQNIEQGEFYGIPTIVIIAVIISLAFHVILKSTRFGRNVYAIGGNAETARISGINIGIVTLIVYILSGALSGVAGILMASRMGSSQPSAGTGFELVVIAAAVIGGTSISGGVGSVLGTIMGAIFMQMLTNSMVLMKISVYWQSFVIGAIIVAAVILDQSKRRLRRIK